MQRARKALVAAIGLGSVLLLGACGTGSPDTAATVSESRITVDQVNNVVAEFEKHEPRVNASSYAGLREDVAAQYVFVEIAKRYAKEKNYEPPRVDYAGVARATGYPESDPYLHLKADSQAYYQLLISRAEPKQPTEADLRGIYDRAAAAGATGGAPFEQLKQAIAGLPQLGEGLRLRDELASAVDRYHVKINPLYGPVNYPVLVLPSQSGQQSLPLLTVALSDEENAAPVTPAATPAVGGEGSPAQR